jgi:HSP20 family protein
MANEIAGRSQGKNVPSRYDPFQNFRNEMDRIFDSFLGGIPALTGLRRSAFEDEYMMPRVDVKETGKEVVVTADLPGLDDKDIDLTLENGMLVLRGEKKEERTEERENYRLMERSHGSFQRSIPLPEGIDEDKVAARFEKGVLTVTLPKRPEAQSARRKIEVGKRS